MSCERARMETFPRIGAGPFAPFSRRGVTNKTFLSSAMRISDKIARSEGSVSSTKSAGLNTQHSTSFNPDIIGSTFVFLRYSSPKNDSLTNIHKTHPQNSKVLFTVKSVSWILKKPAPGRPVKPLLGCKEVAFRRPNQLDFKKNMQHFI